MGLWRTKFWIGISLRYSCSGSGVTSPEFWPGSTTTFTGCPCASEPKSLEISSRSKLNLNMSMDWFCRTTKCRKFCNTKPDESFFRKKTKGTWCSWLSRSLSIGLIARGVGFNSQCVQLCISHKFLHLFSNAQIELAYRIRKSHH